MTLNDRARAALLLLADMTEPPAPGAAKWAAGLVTVGALDLVAPLEAAGFDLKRGRRGYPGSAAAARTLIALKNRGLADSDGGGCFLPSRWWITTAGREHAAELRR